MHASGAAAARAAATASAAASPATAASGYHAWRATTAGGYRADRAKIQAEKSEHAYRAPDGRVFDTRKTVLYA